MDEILSFRAIYTDKIVKFFTNKDKLEIYDELSFDSEFSQNTSVDFFISGIMSGIILSISKGLTNGDKIIIDNFMKIAPGVPVKEIEVK